MVVLYTVCQRSKQVKIWWCEVRTVWWVFHKYSYKFSAGCGGGHVCPGIVLEEQHLGIFLVGKTWKRQAFGLLSRSSTVVSLGNQCTKTPVASQYTVGMISPSNGTPLNICHGGVVRCHCIDGCLDLCATWLILVASAVTVCNRRPSPLVPHLFKTSVVIAFLASVWIWQHLWHLTMSTGTGITKLCPPFWTLISRKSMEWCQMCCCSVSAGH
jgi:hypothetical protein